jgi:lysophospholipase L1-like esterase
MIAFFMKLQVLLVSLLCAGSVFAQEKPLTITVPVVPQGVNSAVFPIGRGEWFQRALAANGKALAVAAPIRLVFDGDSITDGWQTSGNAVWAARYGKLNAFDFGISGDRTQHVLWRLDQGQVNGLKPRLVALMIGTNNMGSNTPEEIAEGVKTIVAEYQKLCPEAVVLLQAIFPRGQKAEDPSRAKIKATNEIIAKLGDGKKVIYVDFGDKFLEPDGSISPEIMKDFLHPTAKGYEIWADAIAPIVAKYVPAK